MIPETQTIINIGDKVSFEAESEILTGYCFAIEQHTITFLAYGKLYPVGRALAERDTTLLQKFEDSEAYQAMFAVAEAALAALVA